MKTRHLINNWFNSLINWFNIRKKIEGLIYSTVCDVINDELQKLIIINYEGKQLETMMYSVPSVNNEIAYLQGMTHLIFKVLSVRLAHNGSVIWVNVELVETIHF